MFCSSPGFACVVGLMWCCMSVLCVSCAFCFALDGRGDGTRVCFGWSMVMGLVCALDGLGFWLRVLAVLEFKLFCVNTFARRSELLVASVVSVLKLSCGLAMCLEMVQSSELLMGLLDLADISQIVIFFCSVLTDCMYLWKLGMFTIPVSLMHSRHTKLTSFQYCIQTMQLCCTSSHPQSVAKERRCVSIHHCSLHALHFCAEPALKQSYAQMKNCFGTNLLTLMRKNKQTKRYMKI